MAKVGLSQEKLARKIGLELAESLQGIADTKTIREMAVNACQEFKKSVPEPNTYRSRLSEMRRAVKEVFPDEVKDEFPNQKEEKSGYYFTDRGKGNIKRWEHVAIFFITSDKKQQELLEPPHWSSSESEEKSEIDPIKDDEIVIAEAPVQQLLEDDVIRMEASIEAEIQPTAQHIKLTDMTIEAFDLETQNIIQDAIAQSGVSLADFIQQACRVYGRTITGKAKQYDANLATIPTSELKDNKAYNTHPGRAEELVRRAIKAIMVHNGQCTEGNQKWVVTQTLLVEMTGSKAVSVKRIVEKYHTMIADHNQLLKENHGLNEYSNRKSTKKEFIENWVNIVPDGMD